MAAAKAKAEGVRHRTSDSRLSVVDLERIHDTVSGSETSASLGRLNASRVAPPLLPAASDRAQLDKAVPGIADSRDTELTEFSRLLCHHRSLFRRTAFCKENEQSTIYLFLFATQSPSRCYFLPLTVKPVAVPFLQGMPHSERVDAAASTPRHAFDYTRGTYCTDRHLKIGSISEAWIWPEVSFTEPGSARADLDPMPLNAYAARHQPKQTRHINTYPLNRGYTLRVCEWESPRGQLCMKLHVLPFAIV